jgi:hypothetical protein
METLYNALSAETSHVFSFDQAHRIFLSCTPEGRAESDNGISALIKALAELRSAGKVRYSINGEASILIGKHTVPREIRVTRARKPKVAKEHRQWDPRVIADALTARGERLDFIIGLDNFLKNHHETDRLVPIKARSLQIFGDEKAITTRASAELRRSGNILQNLSPFDLRCYVPNEHYFVFEAYGNESRAILIVENTETYHVMKERNLLTQQYRAVVFGAGNAFSLKAPHIETLAHELSALEALYFGDIDPPGFQIVQRASAALSGSRINLYPATDLYGECLRIGKPKLSGYGNKYAWELGFECETRSWTRDWMAAHPTLFSAIDDVISSKKRLAQEWTGLT